MYYEPNKIKDLPWQEATFKKRQKKKGKGAKDRDRKKRQTDRRNRKIVLATH